jgi:hypothetical protein
MAILKSLGIDSTTGQKVSYIQGDNFLGFSTSTFNIPSFNNPDIRYYGQPVVYSVPIVNTTDTYMDFLTICSGTTNSLESLGESVDFYNNYFPSSIPITAKGDNTTSVTALLPFRVYKDESASLTYLARAETTAGITVSTMYVGGFRLPIQNGYTYGLAPNSSFLLDQTLISTSGFTGSGGWQDITGASVTLNGVQANSKVLLFLHGRYSDPDAAFKVRFLEGANDLTTTYFDSYVNYSASTSGDAAVKLLVQSETTDGDTSFTDSGITGHTVTANGAVDHTTTVSKFGSSSIDFQASTNHTDYLSVADSTDFTFTGDFTIDFWVRIGGFTGGGEVDRGMFGTGDITTAGTIGILQKGAFDDRVEVTINGVADALVSSTFLNTGTFYHIAVVRSGSTITLYRDGASQGTYSFAGTLDATGIRIGSIEPTGSFNSFDGWMEEVRVTNDAKWTAPFTPPTSPYAGAGTVPVDKISTYAYLTNTFSAGNYTFKAQLDPLTTGSETFDYGSFYALEIPSSNASHFNTSPTTPTGSASDFISVGSLTVSEGSSLVIFYQTKATNTTASTDYLEFTILVDTQEVSYPFRHGSREDGVECSNNTMFVTEPLSSGTYTVKLNGSYAGSWTHVVSSILIFEVKK